MSPRRQARPDRVWTVVAVGLLLLAGFLRLAWPTLTEFKFSEARLEALALELLRDGRLPLVGVPSSAGFDHSPLSVYLYLPAFLFTPNPIPATIYGGLAGALAVALGWWFARRWPGGGQIAAATSLLLFAVSPWAVMFSRKIWQVAFVPLLSVVVVGLIVLGLIGGRRWAVCGAIVAYAVLVQVHPSALALLPAMALWLVVFWRQLRPVPVLTGGAVSGLTLVPMLVHQIKRGWPVLSALGKLPDARWDLAAPRVAWDAVTGEGLHSLAGQAFPHLDLVPEMEPIFGVVGLTVMVGGVLSGWRMVHNWRATVESERQAARVDLILLTWLVIPIAFNLRHSLELPLHFLALVLPAAFLVAGRAVQMMVGQAGLGSRRAAGAVLAATAALQVAALALMLQFVATHDTKGGFGVPLREYLKVASETVATAKAEGAQEVLVAGKGSSPDVSEIPAVFDVLLRDRISFRFVDRDMAAVFPDHRALILLDPEPGEATHWYEAWPACSLAAGYKTVVLDGTWPSQRFVRVGAPRLFANGVEVQGYAWADALEQGSDGRLWLLWQLLWQDGGDSHFTVRLVDEAEVRVWAQQDGPGLAPASRRRGDRVISAFYIMTSAEGNTGALWLVVGQYLFPEMESIPVIDARGASVGDRLLVGPVAGGP